MTEENAEIVAEETEETKEEIEVKEVEEPSTSKATENTELIEALKKEFAEKIRIEEKNKLYPTIEKYKQDIKDQEEANKALKAKMQEYEDSHLSTEERIQKQVQELMEANSRLETQLDRVSEEAAKEIYKIQLDAARDKALVMYGDNIIVDMISGSTIEEIYESAEKANSVYLQIKAKAEEDAKAASKTVQIGSTVNPKSGSSTGSLEMDIQDIKNITDPKEWEKVKEKLKAKAMGLQ